MTSSTLYREGDDLDTLLGALSDEHGSRVRIVAVDEERPSGRRGFLARRRVSVQYRLDPGNEQAPAPAGDPLADLIARADAAETGAPASAPAPAPAPVRAPAPARARVSPPAAVVPTATPEANAEFASMLLELAAKKAAERMATTKALPKAPKAPTAPIAPDLLSRPKAPSALSRPSATAPTSALSPLTRPSAPSPTTPQSAPSRANPPASTHRPSSANGPELANRPTPADRPNPTATNRPTPAPSNRPTPTATNRPTPTPAPAKRPNPTSAKRPNPTATNRPTPRSAAAIAAPVAQPVPAAIAAPAAQPLPAALAAPAVTVIRAPLAEPTAKPVTAPVAPPIPAPFTAPTVRVIPAPIAEPAAPARSIPPAVERPATFIAAPPPPPLSGSDAALVLRRRLADIGVPVHLLPSASVDPAAAVTNIVAALPEMPRLPAGRHTILALVGASADLVLAARRLTPDLGVPADRVWIAGLPTDALPAAFDLEDAAEAATAARWARADSGELIVALIATDVPRTNNRPQQPARIVEALEPDAVWAVVDATRKPADARRRLADVSAATGAIVIQAAETASPASVLELGLPVAMLDGEPATRRRWIATLLTALGEQES